MVINSVKNKVFQSYLGAYSSNLTNQGNQILYLAAHQDQADDKHKHKAHTRDKASKISAIRNFVGMVVALSGFAGVAGLAAAEGGALLVTKSGVIAAILDFLTTAFTVFDFAVFVPNEIKDFAEQLKHVFDGFSFKSFANIASKFITIFFALKWFVGDRFLKGIHLGEQSIEQSSNLLKIKKGEAPWIAIGHIVRAHTKNLSGYPSTVFAWFGRTALLKHISLKWLPSNFVKHQLSAQGKQKLSKVLHSLFYFLLAILPGWRGQADSSEVPRYSDLV
jgi:hypothetical protein